METFAWGRTVSMTLLLRFVVLWKKGPKSSIEVMEFVQKTAKVPSFMDTLQTCHKGSFKYLVISGVFQIITLDHGVGGHHMLN